MKKLVFVVGVLLPFFLLSCGSGRGYIPSDYRFLGKFPKGTTRPIIAESKGNNPLFMFKIGGDSLVADTHVDLYEMEFSSGTPWYLFFLGGLATHKRYDLVIFAYQKYQLIFSGTLDDFKKSENPEISEIGHRISSKLLLIL